VKLLSGGNPQIAKGDGPAVVEAYLSAMPGWKQIVGRRLDSLIVAAVPGVLKAVRWNSPFYGTTEHGWFLSFHCLTRYVKVAFFAGASLSPMPPVESKVRDTRYHHIFENDPMDDRLLMNWFRQASRLPGWSTFGS
jgi:hypothetical protein